MSCIAVLCYFVATRSFKNITVERLTAKSLPQWACVAGFYEDEG